MAKLFEEIFTDRGSSDVILVLCSAAEEDDEEQTVPQVRGGAAFEDAEGLTRITRLRCHSLVLMQHPYFCKMLSPENSLREGITREVTICEPREEFLSLIRYLYTSQVDITRCNVLGILTLADKYCVDEVVDMCLRYIKDHFDADMFYSFYESTSVNFACRDKLTDQFMSALKCRRILCSITWDERWCQLPVDIVETILAQDDLPISSEAEVLTLIAQWLLGPEGQGQVGHSKQDVARLMGACRRCDSICVRVADVAALTQALGLNVFSSKEPRNGSAVWDPSFVVCRHEAACPQPVMQQGEHRPEAEDMCFQLGPKDTLYQEPGWTCTGTHRCRVTLTCTSWSHRERRILRTTSQSALQKRTFECSPAPKSASRERSPSPPTNFQVRLPPREVSMPSAMSDGSEQVDHQIMCGVSSAFPSGNQKFGVRISQREKNAIYTVEDLQGKQSLSVGGTTSTVSFDLELLLGEASKYDIRRCRFALIRGGHRLTEEWFDVSAKVQVKFFFSSASFDKNSSYSISVKWHAPVDHNKHFYIGT